MRTRDNVCSVRVLPPCSLLLLFIVTVLFAGCSTAGGSSTGPSNAPCGLANTACCAGQGCAAGLACEGAVCVTDADASSSGGSSSGDSGTGTGGADSGATCGALGEACCAGSTCASLLACRSGACQSAPANGTGAPCTANSGCPSGICQPISIGGTFPPTGEGYGAVCTTSCGSVSDCVAGWTCAAERGQSSDVCQCDHSAEVCDGKDNDCDGVVDDEPAADQGCALTAGPGQVCQNGACVCSLMCGGQCVDPKTDGSNCGGCGTTCMPGASCTGGSCVCQGGKLACDGACIDGQTDENNCGGCGTKCASSTCSSGICTGRCSPGQTNCDSNTPQTCGSDGQWVDGTACDVDTTCVSGTCTGVCGPGQTQCNGNGVQTCGSNGQWSSAVACTGNTPVCLSGGCFECSPSATRCSGNGVETCGSDGQWGSAWACATGTCSAGACTGQTTTGPSCVVPTSVAPPMDAGLFVIPPPPAGSGLTNCGSASESCCTSIEVPGGTYDWTYTNSGSGATGEADPATVSGFRMDKYLVTVGRYRQFVAAWKNGSGYRPAAGSGKHTHLNGGSGLNATGGGYESGWDATDLNNTSYVDPGSGSDGTFTAAPGSQENLPINYVTWYEAYAFCIWDGGFLPSEAEWEYVAAGGGQQREYPWGSTAPGTGNQYAIYDYYYPTGTDDPTGTGNIAPVGTAASGAGLWGHLDMAGELFEWNLDWYAGYAPCTDCANLSTATVRVFRGGSFYNDASSLPSAARLEGAPEGVDYYAGFRCARTP